MRKVVIAFVWAACFAAGGVAAVSAPKPTPTPQLTKHQQEQLEERLEKEKASAPADEYFGKMKLSFLGIDNTFRDQSIRAGSHTTDSSVISKTDFAADSLRDWQHKYPKDPQLARSMFLGSQTYLKIWTAAGQEQAAYYLITLRNKFPTTYFGKQAKAELGRGLTMHVMEAAQPCILLADTVQPTPAPVPTPNPKYNIKVSVEPAPCYVATPQPTATGIVTPPSPSCERHRSRAEPERERYRSRAKPVRGHSLDLG